MALLVALFALRSQTARADDAVSAEFFTEALAPHGEWVNVGDYGACWHPTKVDCDWAPYTDGYWAYTDAGWTWVSYEDFGGIVYHYGRWVQVQNEGWCWAPGYEWAPAWVSWRSNNDAIGWAPLPPEARWRGEIGFSVWADSAYDIGPGYYNFCHIRDFGAPSLRGVIINRDQNVTFISATTNITNITYNNYGGSRVVFVGGPNFAAVNAVATHPVPALTLVQNSHFDPAQIRGGGGGPLIASRMTGNQLIVAAPLVAPPVDPNFFKGKATRTIEAGKVTKGWEGVKDPAARQTLRQQVQAQTKGQKPETAHARPVVAAELQVLPVKLNTNPVEPSGEKPHGGIEKPIPSTAVTKPAAPVAPAAAPTVPHVAAVVEKPAAHELHKPTAPIAEGPSARKEGEFPPARKEAEVPLARKEGEFPPAKKEAEVPPAKKEAEFPPAKKEVAHTGPTPAHVAPHEELHTVHPTPAPKDSGKKASATPRKDKDKDKDKDRNGN